MRSRARLLFLLLPTAIYTSISYRPCFFLFSLFSLRPRSSRQSSAAEDRRHRLRLWCRPRRRTTSPSPPSARTPTPTLPTKPSRTTRLGSRRQREDGATQESSRTLGESGSVIRRNKQRPDASSPRLARRPCLPRSRYIDVDSHGQSLFFYFFESRGNPKKDPVMLWSVSTRLFK